MILSVSSQNSRIGVLTWRISAYKSVCRESLTMVTMLKCILKMSLSWTYCVSCKKGKFRHTRYNRGHLPWRRTFEGHRETYQLQDEEKSLRIMRLLTAWLSWNGIHVCYLMCVCEDFCTIFCNKSQNQYCKMNNADIFKLSSVFIRRHKFLRTQKAYFSKKNIKARSTILDYRIQYQMKHETDTLCWTQRCHSQWNSGGFCG